MVYGFIIVHKFACTKRSNSRGEMIELEEEIFDGQDFDLAKTGFIGILSQSVGAHDGAGRVVIGHARREAMQDAPVLLVDNRRAYCNEKTIAYLP